MFVDALLDALAVLFPVECAGCGACDRSLCSQCREALNARVTVRRVGGLRVHVGLEYSGAVRRTILALKTGHRTDAAAALSRPLALAAQSALDEHPAARFVLVPSSSRAFRARGFDPVLLLARHAGIRATRGLVHTGAATVQKGLGIAQRTANRSGAFTATRSFESREVIIVDDVLTTGATLLAASHAIDRAGGRVVAAVTLAFTPRLLPFRDTGDDEDYGGAKGA